MDMNLNQPLLLLVAGAAAFGLAALLWALRISDGARGAAKKYREEEQKARERLARAESVFGAHPGVIMVWEDEEEGAKPKPQSEWGLPNLYGSPVALMGILRFADDGTSDDPGVRILEGLADLVIETRLSIVGDNLLRALVLFSHLAQSDRGRKVRPRGALS